MDQKVGMYGGKFLPLHKGHLYCIDVASKECDLVYAILFVNGTDELEVRKNDKPEYSIEARFERLKNICKYYPNVKPIIIDVSKCKKKNGSEDWDAETPLVRKYIPKMFAVYSSEPSYGEYFARAYPEAVHRIIDAKRIKYPISATMIRAMKTLKEKEKWIV